MHGFIIPCLVTLLPSCPLLARSPHLNHLAGLEHSSPLRSPGWVLLSPGPRDLPGTVSLPVAALLVSDISVGTTCEAFEPHRP